MFLFLRALSNIKDVVQYSSIAKIFYLPEYSKQAKLAKFIRFEACAFLSFQINAFGFDWKLKLIFSITKFTKNSWCVSVFESTKQSQRCCSIFFNRKDFLFCLIFQASKVGEIHSLWSVCFFNLLANLLFASFDFIFSCEKLCVFKIQKLIVFWK